MPWYSREEADQHEQLQLDFAALEERNAMLEQDALRNIETMDGQRATITDLQEQLARYERTQPVSKLIVAEMIKMEESGQIELGAAEVAGQVILKRYHDQAEAHVADNLISTTAESTIAQFGPEVVKQLEAEKREAYEKDGTLARVDRETRAQEHLKIRDRVLGAFRRKRKQHYESPIIHGAMVADAEEQLENDGTFARIDAEMRQGLEPQWRNEAIENARLYITRGLEAERTAYMQRYGRDWTESPQGIQFRRQTESTLQQQWQNAAVQDVANAIKDDTLRKLLSEKSSAMTADLARQAIFRNHLADFMLGGTDTSSIPEGSVVHIQLGEPEAKEISQRDPFSYNSYNSTAKTIRSLRVEREIGLVATGDGTFTVVSDTLGNSTNPYEQNDAMHEGQVIEIGRAMELGKQASLDSRIRKGGKLAYDPDPTDPAFIRTHHRVANIVIDGLSARSDIQQVELPNGSITAVKLL